MEGSQEVEKLDTIHDSATSEFEPAGANISDVVSLISQGSTFYSPFQRDDVIERFCRALLRQMRAKGSYYEDTEICRQRSLPHLRWAIKEFSETAIIDQTEIYQEKARKLVRRLRFEIAKKIQDDALNASQGPKHKRTSINLGLETATMSWPDIVSRWKTTLVLPHDNFMSGAISENMALSKQVANLNDGNDNLSGRTISDAGFCASESSEGSGDAAELWESVDLAKLSEHFVKQPAFTTLARTAGCLFERYHAQKMNLIRHRISLALRRSLKTQQMTGSSSSCSASFRVDWDLQGFLDRNYTARTKQRLAQILSVTGFIDHAKPSTVGEYFHWCWPKQSSQHLLAAIENELEKKYAKFSKGKGYWKDSSVTVDATTRFIAVTGTEDFVVSIAQQIAWLAAVCQDKRDRLSIAYVGFTEADNDEMSENSVPTFDIDVRVEDAALGDSDSCWNGVVGPAVIVSRFPIPERKNGERGLEISIPVMEALSGTPQAVTVSGGAAFKGRCHALVPIAEMGSSLQWHMINTFPQKLEWSSIDTHCPQRLRGHRMNKEVLLRKRRVLPPPYLSTHRQVLKCIHQSIRHSNLQGSSLMLRQQGSE